MFKYVVYDGTQAMITAASDVYVKQEFFKTKV